jgi:hypothetical protein
MIDWTNPDDMVSSHFSVKEAIYLPTWGRMATEEDGLNDEVKSNLIKLFTVMDQVRDYFNTPIHVHVTYRPAAYNKQIGGALNSSHIQGLACDFDVVGMVCEVARQKILTDNMLETWNMRMENNGSSSNWIHLSIDWIPGHNRYFLP